MKFKLLSLLMAICMVISLFPAAVAVEPAKAPATQEHTHETEPVLPQGIEEYPELEFGTEVVLTANGKDYSYATFTPETTGNYRITATNEWNYGLNGVFYDADMNYIDECYSCWVERHEHPYYRTFCFTQKMEAGATYVLAFRFDEGIVNSENVSIHVFCGHNYVSEVTKKATCAETGIITYTCTFCGDNFEEEVVVPHKLVSEITNEGTCAEPGTIVNTCDVCGYQETEEYNVAHNYEMEVIKETTCTQDGLERYTCTICGHCYERNIWGNHDYRIEHIPGSCTQMGYDVYTCTVCGYTDEESSWYEHEYEDVVTREATCTEYGRKEDRCTLCGDVRYVDEIEPRGHAYGEDLKCIRCDMDAPSTWGDLNWNYADGVLTITGEGEMPELEYIEAWDDIWIDNTPWKDLPVREAVIGEGITNVTAALFQDREELQKVTLPSTLTRIETRAFVNCSALTEIILPESLTYVGSDTFANCDLREVHIPAGLVEDFYPDFDWFNGNRNLKRFTVDENNPVFCADDQGVLYSKDMTELLAMPEGFEGTYILPASVTVIDDIFYDCAGLDTIEVENGNAAYFSRNGMLYQKAVYSDTYGNGNTIYRRCDNVLKACPPARELGDYTIDAQTGGIDQEAFRNCVNLTGLTVPKTCTTNPDGSIDPNLRNILTGCSKLEFVHFEEGHPDHFHDENGFVYNAQTIGIVFHGQFEPGTALQFVPASKMDGYLQIPEGVEGISVYLDSPELRAVRFPSTLRALDNYVLRDCTLDWILFTGDEPENADMGETEWAYNVTAKLYYPNWLKSWNSFYLDEVNCDLTYIPYEQGKEPVWGQEEPEQPEKPENPFTDVPAGSFFAEPVAWALEESITTGASADSFNPNGQCLRAQVVTFLWRAEGCPEPKSTVNPFVDVKPTDFYYKAVLWAVENQITNGSDATHFNPLGVCNRAQVVTFLHRAKKAPAPGSMELPFTDVPGNSWYTAPVAWAVEKGITNGLSATTFGPDAACNRAQVVTFLYRAYH